MGFSLVSKREMNLIEDEEKETWELVYLENVDRWTKYSVKESKKRRYHLELMRRTVHNEMLVGVQRILVRSYATSSHGH